MLLICNNALHISHFLLNPILRDVVYLQTVVQMMNGTGLECERQSIIFYLSPQIKSINVVNQTGNIDNVTLKTPLNPVNKSVQFTVSFFVSRQIVKTILLSLTHSKFSWSI